MDMKMMENLNFNHLISGSMRQNLPNVPEPVYSSCNTEKTWNPLESDMFDLGFLPERFSFQTKLARDDFVNNGIESELDEFDMYQARLRSFVTNQIRLNSIRPVDCERKGKRPQTWFSKNTVCVFCKNNKETLSVYGTHVLKDSLGRITCPILRRYTCPICGSSGENAHTIKYCPLNLSFETNDGASRATRTSLGKRRPYNLQKRDA